MGISYILSLTFSDQTNHQVALMTNIKYDCIIIPGGGLLGDGSLPAWTLARLEKAAELQHSTEWIVTLSGGTAHKPPPLNQDGFPIFESRKAAEFLAASGFDPGKILSEISSYDTIGNAYFSRLLFSDPLSLMRCHVITSEFHMARTQAVFNWIYSLLPVQRDRYLSFDSTPNTGLSQAALKARIIREKSSLDKLQRKIQDIKTLTAFHHWLYTEHTAYAIHGDNEQLTSDELLSY